MGRHLATLPLGQMGAKVALGHSFAWEEPFRRRISYAYGTINDLKVIHDYLGTEDKSLWDEFMNIAHLNERAIGSAVFTNPLQAIMLAQLFKMFKVIKKIGGDFSEWRQDGLDKS